MKLYFSMKFLSYVTIKPLYVHYLTRLCTNRTEKIRHDKCRARAMENFCPEDLRSDVRVVECQLSSEYHGCDCVCTACFRIIIGACIFFFALALLLWLTCCERTGKRPARRTTTHRV